MVLFKYGVYIMLNVGKSGRRGKGSKSRHLLSWFEACTHPQGTFLMLLRMRLCMCLRSGFDICVFLSVLSHQSGDLVGGWIGAQGQGGGGVCIQDWQSKTRVVSHGMYSSYASKSPVSVLYVCCLFFKGLFGCGAGGNGWWFGSIFDFLSG